MSLLRIFRSKSDAFAADHRDVFSRICRISAVVTVSARLVCTLHADAKSLLPADPEKAWTMVQEGARPLRPPADWNREKPTQAEYDAFRLKMGEAAAKGADLAKEFAARWPKDAHAVEASVEQRKLLTAAVQLGVKDRSKELESLPDAPETSTPGTPPVAGTAGDESSDFDNRFRAAVRQAQGLEKQGVEAMLLDYEKSLRLLQKEFPKRPEIFAGLMEVAGGVDSKKGLSIAEEIIASSEAPDDLRQAATALKNQLGRFGKPVKIAFTAMDGRDVDLEKLKGKVVLIDFWATVAPSSPI